MSEEALTYYEQRLPDLIRSLKSQVHKNMDVIDADVESDLSSDKFLNVLKARRLAAEHTKSTLIEIDKLEQELKINKEEGYYLQQLPLYIDRLKRMFDINLKVVDLDMDEEDFDVDLRSEIGDQIGEIFGPELSKKIFKKLGSDKLTEDKYVNVLRARDTARIDNQWVLKLIDTLERELNGEEKVEIKKSWAKIASQGA